MLERLPTELLLKIFRYLSSTDLRCLCIQSRSLRSTSQPLLFVSLSFVLQNDAEVASVMDRIEGIRSSRHLYQTTRSVKFVAPKIHPYREDVYGDESNIVRCTRALFGLLSELPCVASISLAFVPLERSSLLTLSGARTLSLTSVQVTGCFVHRDAASLASLQLSSVELGMKEENISLHEHFVQGNQPWSIHLIYPHLFLSPSTRHLVLDFDSVIRIQNEDRRRLLLETY
jgi:hypothetical protein